MLMEHVKRKFLEIHAFGNEETSSQLQLLTTWAISFLKLVTTFDW